MVADALSRKTQGVMASLWVCRWKMLSMTSEFDLHVAEVGERLALCNLVARPMMLQRVIDAQLLDPELANVMRRLSSGRARRWLAEIGRRWTPVYGKVVPA